MKETAQIWSLPTFSHKNGYNLPSLKHVTTPYPWSSDVIYESPFTCEEFFQVLASSAVLQFRLGPNRRDARRGNFSFQFFWWHLAEFSWTVSRDTWTATSGDRTSWPTTTSCPWAGPNRSKAQSQRWPCKFTFLNLEVFSWQDYVSNAKLMSPISERPNTG